MEREPRAALIVNRFTRSLKIMYATPSVALVLGLSPNELQERPLYCCIQDNCLADASHCLESAKQNDSIAYLRFWYRDPRTVDDEGNPLMMDEINGHGGHADGERPGSSPSDSEGGGAPLENDMAIDSDSPSTAAPETDVKREAAADYSMDDIVPFPSTSASSMSNPLERGAGAFDRHSADMAYQTPVTRASSVTATQAEARVDGALQRRRQDGSRRRQSRQPLELEAVVSCTSDGLVVVLRKARPAVPVPHPQPAQAPTYANGLFAAPWAMHPVRPQYPPEAVHSFQAPLMPHYMPLQESGRSSSGPPIDQLMSSIRDVAVFAWGLVGINGRLTEYAHGSPHGDAQPDVLPVWDPHAGDTEYQGPVNNAAIRWAELERQDKGKAPQPSPPIVHFDSLVFNPFAQPAERQFGRQGAALEFGQNQQSPFAHFYPQTSPSIYGQMGQMLPMPATFDGRSTHGAYGTQQQQEHWPQARQQSLHTSVFLSMAPSQPAQPQMQTHLHHHHHHLHTPQTSVGQLNGDQRQALPRDSWLDTVSTRPHSQGFVVPTTQPSSPGLQQNQSSFQRP
jgi:hypothetical protein